MPDNNDDQGAALLNYDQRAVLQWPPSTWRLLSCSLHLLFGLVLYGHWIFNRKDFFHGLLGNFWQLKLSGYYLVAFPFATCILYVLYLIVMLIIEFLDRFNGLAATIPKLSTLLVQTTILAADFQMTGTHVVFVLHTASFLAFNKSVTRRNRDFCGLISTVSVAFMSYGMGLIKIKGGGFPPELIEYAMGYSDHKYVAGISLLLFLGLSTFALYCLERGNHFDGSVFEGFCLYLEDVATAVRFMTKWFAKLLEYLGDGETGNSHVLWVTARL